MNKVIFSVVLFISASIFANCLEALGHHSPNTIPNAPSKQAIAKHVFAVSALREVPLSSIILADSRDHDKFDAIHRLPTTVRLAVHWSLNELVRPHSGIQEWEKRRIAIVRPLDSLENLANINPYDTFVFGNVVLGPESTLVVPETDLLPECNCKIFTYKPDRQTLREAIKEVVAIYGGWPITLRSGEATKEIDPGFEIAGTTYRTSQFFRNYLDDKPHVSIGTEIDSLLGEASRFTTLSQLSSLLVDSFASLRNNFGSEYYIFQLELIEHHMIVMKQSKLWQRLTQPAKNQLLTSLDLMNQMLNIARVDQELRQNHCKTLIDTDLKPEIWLGRGDISQLRKLVFEDVEFTNSLYHCDAGLNATAAHFALGIYTLPRGERDKFIQSHAKLFCHVKISEIIEFVLKIEELTAGRVASN